MTDTFDLELRNRLAGLAGAVPVDGGSALHARIAAVVRPGLTSRRLVVGGFAPLAVVVAAAVVASLGHIGPFAPAATAGIPLVSAVQDGPFMLTITSAKSRYALRESVDVTASLTFRGPEGSVSIAHGHGSPMAFGVIERVGGLFLTPAWRQSCEQSVLERDVPLVRPFAKSGSFSGDHPAASDAAGFFEDPTLELPAGTWHLYVVADFGVGDCGVDRHLLRTDLEIVVGDGQSDPNPAPVASEVTIEQPSAAIATPPPEPTSPANPPLESLAPAPAAKGEIELATGYVSRLEDGTRVCLMARGGGALAVNPRTGLGFTDPSTGAVTDVVWPEGYSARFQDGKAILIDESGNVVAREGELITMAGGYSSDNNTFHICGAGIVE